MSFDDYQKIVEENERLKREIQDFHDLVSQLRRKQYGTSSEKVSAEQLGMFDEVESEALNPEPEDDESITVPEHKRKRGKRLKLPPNLPRADVVIDLGRPSRGTPGGWIRWIRYCNQK